MKMMCVQERSFTEEEEQKLGAALSLDTHTLRLLLEALSFILEQAVYHGVKPGALRILLEQIGIDSEKAEIFNQIRLKSPSAIINLRLSKEELSQMEKIQTQLDSLT
ncbi:hypothetical protein DNTS_004411 [Danionella cerebrum]|uniref:COMM domain-containing protein n=1 Tax=Danionella cerebrum TaxID=2873325 RepID=A0A553NHD2_9TELE|nr:hypothetical protein DNTS_004411 [Danionella translucida]